MLNRFLLDSRQLTPEEFIELLESMPDATHEKMNSLDVHSGVHPKMGSIVIVCSSDQDAVLVHPSSF
ncbi:MAG: hypothetical protein ACI9A2_002724 [Halioglobus sp.]|jgi:hypothetical protein